jgi:phosphopantothenoylcysteine decarboxylase/phosphopantothenate--cysteine ligase
MARLILGISGSIAAYKAADLASRLKKRGHHVNVVMTASAEKLISPNTFLNLTGERVFRSDPFDSENGQTEHIAITDKADLVVVAPATANVIAKIALGLADDMLTTTLLAVRSPVLVCPAMNTRMWNHPSVGKHLSALREQGIHILEPDAGSLACGHVGPGRLAGPPVIEAEIERLLAGAPTRPAIYFLERLSIKEALPPDVLLAERAWREALLKDGSLTGWGPLAGTQSEFVAIHRGESLEKVRARAAASPLAKRGARVEIFEWNPGS